MSFTILAHSNSICYWSPFKCCLLFEPVQMSFAIGAHSNVMCNWSPFKYEILRRFSGDSQEILRRFSGDSQEILRRFSGDAQEILIDSQEWKDSPIQLSFTLGAHSNDICYLSPFK